MSASRVEPVLVTGLLDPGSCMILRELVDRSPDTWAETSQEESSGFEADIARRRVRLARLPTQWSRPVHNRLQAIAPALAEQFGVQLRTLESPQFLRYTAGHFYTPHRDTSSEAGSREVARKLTLVLHLSDALERPGPASRPGWYCGGELRIQLGAHDRTPMVRCGQAIVFPSWALHAVTPVTAGVRHVVVAWYA